MNMKRVVITGTGIVSCIGNDAATVTQSLRDGKAGSVALPDHGLGRGLVREPG